MATDPEPESATLCGGCFHRLTRLGRIALVGDGLAAISGVVTRPLRRCTGLQLDHPELRLTPHGVAGGDTRTGPARLADAADRLLEFPARRNQRRGVLGGGERRVAGLLAFELEALTFGPLMFRRCPQDRRELRDGVWWWGLR